jgi:hypothetical protein
MLSYSLYVRLLKFALWQRNPDFATLKAMKKATLRVTKWLGDIPVEGCCSFCPETLFHAASSHHRPQKAEYTESLQRAFDRHVADCHREEITVQRS